PSTSTSHKTRRRIHRSFWQLPISPGIRGSSMSLSNTANPRVATSKSRRAPLWT
ncbi:hypothetical protein FRC17_005094, partial [Serendipita sp. 399]